MGGEVLVLGIVGLMTWLIPFFGLPIPLIGLVWGIFIIRKRPPKRLMVYTGVVMCSLGLVLSVGYSTISVLVNTTPTTVSPPSNGSSYNPPDTGPVEWVADGEIKDGEYDNSKSFGNSYELFWNSDGEFIYIGIRAATTGWVALGIQPDLRSSTDVDMIMGYVSTTGEVFIYDLFNAEYPGLNPIDQVLGGSNDVLLVAGIEGRDELVDPGEEEEGPTLTTIEFARRLNTGDPFDQLLYNGPNTIIWAYGEQDSRDSPPYDEGYGVLEIN
jgi:hypothetical protein